MNEIKENVELPTEQIVKYSMFELSPKFYISFYTVVKNHYVLLKRKKITNKTNFIRFNRKMFTINFSIPSSITGRNFEYYFDYNTGVQLFFVKTDNHLNTKLVDLLVRPEVIKNLVTHLQTSNFTFTLVNILIGILIGIMLGYILGNFIPISNFGGEGATS